MAATFAEELRRAVAGQPFAVADDSASLTLSIGVAADTNNPSRLPGWANLAKAEAKRLGRNRTVATLDGLTFREVRPEASG